MPKRQGQRNACHLAALPGGVAGGTADWERLVARMPAGWEERARTHGALERRRAVRSAGGLLRLVLGVAVLGWGLRLVAAWADLVGIAPLSDVAVGKRVRKARPWLSQEVARLLRLRRERWAGRAVRVRLVDATTVSGPGSRGTDWRVHAVVDLEPGALAGVELTDAHGAESLVRQPPAAGEIAVADRGHARRTDLGKLLPQAGDLVVRIGWQSLPLETPAGERLDLIAWLQRDVGTATERPVQVRTPTGPHPLRLLAAPLPPDQAEQARRRCRRAARDQGRTIEQRTLVAAGFVLLVTTLDPTTWRPDDVLALYRCRWQIELLFKRLKGLWHLDALRARDPDSAQVFILSVLLGALLAADLADAAPLPLEPWLDDAQHPLSRWRWDALWHDALRQAVCGALDLLTLHTRLPAWRRYLCDSPRRRPHQATAARHFLRAHPPHQEQACA